MGETAQANLSARSVEDLFSDYDRLAQQLHQAERYVREVQRRQRAIREEIATRTRRNPQWEVSVVMNDTVHGAKLDTVPETERSTL